LNQADSVDPKTTKSVRSTPPLRPDTRQLNQNTKETAKPPVNTQTKPLTEAQVLNKPDTRSAHPSSTVTQRVEQKEQPQPRAVTQQPRSGSVARQTGREPTRVPSAQDRRIQQGGAVQKDEKIEKGNRPQTHQETRQSRSYAEQRQHR
jgi:hypothetical protein